LIILLIEVDNEYPDNPVPFIDARGEMADEILEKLEKIKDDLIRNGNAERRKMEYATEISDLKGMLSVERTSGWVAYAIKSFLKGLLVLLTIGALIVILLSSVLPPFLLNCLEWLVLLAPVYSPGIGLAIKLRRHSRLKERIRSAQEGLEQAFFKSEEMFGI